MEGRRKKEGSVVEGRKDGKVVEGMKERRKGSGGKEGREVDTSAACPRERCP